MTDQLLRTPLYDFHVSRRARMVPFAGWEMPVQYTGIIEEHVHTRTACAVFDVSHMGRLVLAGRDCESLLDHVCTRNLKGATPGRSYYSHVCREDGGILDDIIVSRFEGRWGVVCNASNRDKIVAWLQRHARGRDVSLKDETLDTVMLACQGPKTIELAEKLTGHDLSTLKRYHFREESLGPAKLIAYRSGYTGEDGLELVFPKGMLGLVLPFLFGTAEAPHPVIRPAGLGARDTLRIEAAMPLYGHELTEDWDSLTAGQAWCVELSKDFVGADAMRRLKEGGLPRQLVGLALEGRRIARQHHKVFRGEREIGTVTSGTLSPTLGTSIAMALVASEHAAEGAALEIELGAGKRVDARVVKLPFYKRAK